MGKNSVEQNRKARHRITLRLTEQESVDMDKLFKSLSIRNKNKYIKSLILGTEGKEKVGEEARFKNYQEAKIIRQELYELNKIGNNINQISKRINATPEVFISKEEKVMLSELQEMLKLKIEEKLITIGR